jgi:hypothetical protein
MDKPDFKRLGFTKDSTLGEVVERMQEFVNYTAETGDEMSHAEVHQAMRGTILCAAAIISGLLDDLPISLVLGMMAGEAMEGEIYLDDKARAEQARLN